MNSNLKITSLLQNNASITSSSQGTFASNICDAVFSAMDSGTMDKTKTIDDSAIYTGSGDDTIIINACSPLLFCYGAKHGDQSLKDRALSLLQQLPAERNRITRLWSSEGRAPKNAADSQALIQRHNDYCVPRRCLDCQLGFRFVKNNTTTL